MGGGLDALHGRGMGAGMGGGRGIDTGKDEDGKVKGKGEGKGGAPYNRAGNVHAHIIATRFFKG